MGIFRSRKTYYVYNPKTLEYERVYPSARERFFVVLRNLTLGIGIGVVAFFVFIEFFDSPMEALLRKENKLLQTHYDMLQRELSQANEVLEDLQQRDASLYRVIFNADSIPEAIRKSGFGGSNRYEHLKAMTNSDLVVETTKRIDMLKKQLYVQSNSLEELIDFARQNDIRLSCIPAIQPIANKDLKRTASGYGTRIHPIYHIRKFHSGMDFAADVGTEIYATGNGKVVFAGRKQNYGNCIIIDHGFDYETLYGHCNKLKVHVGQKVVRGEVIGFVGNTGVSTGPHLHYEVLYKGRHDNPAKYYFQDLNPTEYEALLQIAENHGLVMD
ncbi:MAG: M23 family metallopeptidase [Tannerella sp.]|jgi:murein DD-endopeptidase MepM/ murein hydrolase activator NlpD|nr:M23 family metallopeptidase [Tannerella sp.]